MITPRPAADRKEQIVSASIDRLFAVGFEGFRLGDVAKDVGINNATLIHHYPSKVALIKAVVERFTERFQAVADSALTDGAAGEKLAWHMRSSVALMRNAPEMFAVLNEIMIRSRRDAEMARLVSVPLMAWRHHIVSLLSRTEESGPEMREQAEAVATACMAQLLGMGLLLSATGHAASPFEASRDRSASRAIEALTNLAEQTL
jgi:TetR/AcrR family transcriptional repressor of nem operon